jgi:hypothetical protein
MIIDSNHAVRFVAGHAAHLNLCSELPVPLDTLLRATDPDTAQAEIWSLVSGPNHGTVSASYFTAANGGVMLPLGLTFYPSGYVGNDSFKVRVTDKLSADTITIYVRTDASLPGPGVIAGPDTVCVGDTVALADTALGGVWNATNTKAAVWNGAVTGIAAGRDTITYAVTNACGTTMVRHALVVKTCPSGLGWTWEKPAGLYIAPNPTNGAFTVHVDSKTDEPLRLTVLDMMGRCITATDGRSNQDISFALHMPPGVYCVTVIAADGVWAQRVVVKQCAN